MAEPKKKNLHKELLKEFEPAPPPPEPKDGVDYKYMIVDGSTGQAVDPTSFAEGVVKTTDKVAMPAMQRKNTDPWKKWWRKKSDVNRKFSRAAERGDIQAMEILIDPAQQSSDYVADVDFQGHDSWTPLHYSAIEG